MLKKLLIIISVSILFLAALFMARIPDFNFKYKDLTFNYDRKEIAGRLALPDNGKSSFPVAIFVHGDGAVNRTGNDEYLYFWESLLDQGIACFSWDKQGIGESQGNWEHQDMEDRALEVITAIEFLKERPEVGDNKIGLIGFSQAGWVMPYVSTLSNYPDFIVSVSGAINVFAQGEYLNSIRLEKMGFSKEEISTYNVLKSAMYDQMANGMTYEEYKEYWYTNLEKYEGEGSNPISLDRFIFSSNKWPDARDHLKNIKCPILGIFGGQDLNVDIEESVFVYLAELSKIEYNDYKIEIFPNGTHGLLKADKFQNNYPSLLDIVIYDEKIYADGFLELMTSWVKSKT